MIKKIICILILFLLIITTLQTQTFAFSISTSINTKNDAYIFKDIENTEGKILIFDDIIGDVHVQYWEHVFNDILVVNDSILLHLDIETGNVIKFKKSWSELDDSISDFKKDLFEPEIYLNKQLLVFPDENDCNYFYTFQEIQEYPVVCWEVWYSNGATILFNSLGENIGYGTPTPNGGFSLSGYDYNPRYPDDPWIHYRKNADVYFQKWCDSTESISLPRKQTVSSYVKNESVQLFYEIAHGDYKSFLINDRWERYYFSTAKKDMENRQPMRFAFIGSCWGMNNVGPDSFSYEFRKGEMKKTVTIGYRNMTHSPWKYSYDWQDHMFRLMDEQKTIYNAFIEACAEYPGIADYVVFVGDEKITVKPKSRQDSLNIFSNSLLSMLLKNCPCLLRLFSLRILFN